MAVRSSRPCFVLALNAYGSMALLGPSAVARPRRWPRRVGVSVRCRRRRRFRLLGHPDQPDELRRPVHRADWLWRKRVNIADITQVKLISVPGLSWLVVPRLVVRAG